MPVSTRSNRSKPSKERGKEMPPPSAATPPRTRTTRSKKVSKQEEVELPKSPTPSTRSTRSTRAKGRTKPVREQVMEEVDLASPPSTRPTRVTRQKGAAKTAKPDEKKGEKKNRSEVHPSLDPVVQISPLKMEKKKKEVVKVAVKGGKKPRKFKRQVIESVTSDDITEEESDIDASDRQISVDLLQKQHLIPIKTALESGYSEGFNRLMALTKDNPAEEKQEKEFQRLLRCKEMPPPPAPAPKAKGKKGRSKRARSPDKTSVKTTEVPESFDFAAETDGQVPAKKKMLIDQSTPDRKQEEEPNKPEEIEADKEEIVDCIKAKPEELENSNDGNEGKESEAEADMFERSILCLEDDQEMASAENKNVEDKLPAPLIEKGTALDKTYDCDTPKDQQAKINATFTPELFTETPKSRVADQTIVISKHTTKDSSKEDEVLAPPTPESDSECTSNAAANSSSGKVSSLVNFFDKNKKEPEAKKGNFAASKTEGVEMNVTRSISPDNDAPIDKNGASANDLNSTYVLPSMKIAKATSAMNVTVCVKKASTADMEEPLNEEPTEPLKPLVRPPTFLHQTNNSRFGVESPASRTFCKEPPSLAVVVEEEDDRKTSMTSDKKSEKTRPIMVTKPTTKDKNKAVSSSSSSSTSSMKSATSQPCLAVNKKLPSVALKTTPAYGSAGKLNEVNKSKPLEEAEKRRLEFLQQKVESSKKKNAEWSKKTEKNKLEEEKRLKEKIKVAQPPPSSSSIILKKPAPIAFGKPAQEGATGGLGFTKPKFNFGPSSKMLPPANLVPPLSKNPFHKPAIPHPSHDEDKDDSFKSAMNERSFLDQTTDGHLSSYDITVYEDLDEDLKHRENKTLPNWASDKEALKVALFSMVLLPEYDSKLPGGFPKPDKNYRLFPSKIGHH